MTLSWMIRIDQTSTRFRGVSPDCARKPQNTFSPVDICESGINYKMDSMEESNDIISNSERLVKSFLRIRGKKRRKKANVCGLCGDIGLINLSEALVYCIKCKSAARHSYCLEELPEDFTAEINWLCEDCIRSPYSENTAKPLTLKNIYNGFGMTKVESKNPCLMIDSAIDHLVNTQNQQPTLCAEFCSNMIVDNNVSNGLTKKTLSSAISGAPCTVSSSDKDTIGRTLSNNTNNLDVLRPSASLELKEEIEKYGVRSPKEISSRQASAFVEPADNKVLKRTSICETNTLDEVKSSSFLEFKEDQIEEKDKEEPIKTLPAKDCSLNGGQDSNVKFTATRSSGTSMKASDKQTKESNLNCGIGIHISTKKRKKKWLRRIGLFSPAKTPREDYHPVISCHDGNIPFIDKRVTGTSASISDKLVVERIETCGTIDTTESSVCFEQTTGEIDLYKMGKPENRSLILPTENKLNNLHPVMDRKGSDNFVDPSDRHIEWFNTKAQINSPCQLTKESLFVAFHVWRGWFNINKSEFGPVRAHLSSKACIKVCNLSRNLPFVLHMQKLPRFVAWPNSFKIYPPTDDSIALYFFPETDSIETVLDELLDDLINKDLMLRLEFNEVELLVFSSFVLPQEHQRLYGKFYAWGVYKPGSTKICSMPADPCSVPNGVTEGCQMRTEADNHEIEPLNASVKEINDSIQPKEASSRFTVDSIDAIEDGNLQTLCRRPSHAASDLRIAKSYTFGLKDVAKRREERVDVMNPGRKLSAVEELEGRILDVNVDDKCTDVSELKSEQKKLEMWHPADGRHHIADCDVSTRKHNSLSSEDIEEGEICDSDS